MWSSAGVTAGIDLALALIAEDLGEPVARLTAKQLVVYYRRPGGQSQYSELLELAPDGIRFEKLIAYMRTHLHEPLPVEKLARRAAMSPRHFARTFRAEMGLTPAKVVERLRAEAARGAFESGARSVQSVAAKYGFGDSESLRRSLIRLYGAPPSASATCDYSLHMPDRIEPEKPQENGSGSKAAEPPTAQPLPIPEISPPMLEVHAPHEGLHSWKDFFIHIATIVIGLFIAVGLEQTVELIHHRHVREQLEEQMRQVFAGDVKSDAISLKTLGGLREYLSQMRSAIKARLDGKEEPLPPSAIDPRMASFTIFPTLAPYDAAKENGTVAYLPTARIRIYNRVAFQRELMATVRERWFDGLAALAAFNERYADSTGNLEMGGVSTTPDLTKLSRAELFEYLSVVAALIKKTDLIIGRYRFFDLECQAILDGARDEDALLKAIAPRRIEQPNATTPTPAPN